jgi:hypothetical protein
MIISSNVFEAYLNCPSKCWFRFRNEVGTGHMYSQWQETQNRSYCKEALKRLIDNTHTDDFIIAPSQPINIKRATWKLASDLVVRKDNLEATVHAIERISLRDKPDQFFGMPDRYKFNKKYGWNLIAYFFYHVIDLGIPQRKVVQGFNRLFNFELNRSTLHNLKISTSTYYASAKQQILGET